MTKYWKTTVQKDGSDVNIYVGTDDEALRRDHAAGSSGSLISEIRQLRRSAEPTEETDHRDLAAGAFHHFMRGKGFTQSDASIIEVESIPKGLQKSIFGGPPGLFAVTVFYG